MSAAEPCNKDALALLDRYDEAGAAFQDALSNDRCSDARKVELRRALTAARNEVVATLSAKPSPETCKEGLQVQPSPGGQGDALELLARFLKEPMHDLDMDHEISLSAARDAIAFALAARQPVEESVEEDVYCAIADMIEPYVLRDGINPEGVLPASVHDSVAILLDHWVKTRQPVGQEPVAPKKMARAVALDLIHAVYEHHGWKRAEGESMTARVHALYDVVMDAGRNRFVATPKPAAPPAQAVDLAADHRGMRVSCSGLLGQVQAGLQRDTGLVEMVRQLHGHLDELGRRWYAGDRKVVDEFLQLYVIEDGARRALIENKAVDNG